MARREITIDQFHAELKAQSVSGREHAAVKCPICGTVQSMALLKAEGCPSDKVETQIAFSCVGRWNKAGPYDPKSYRGDKVGCDWTLGGLFQLHTLVVIDGASRLPAFEPASPEEAQALERQIADAV